MKKNLLFLIIGLLLLIARASAQNDTLGVVAISSDYPQCPDTAFSQHPYPNIQFTIHNYDSVNAFTGSLFIYFKSDSIYPPDSVALNAGSVFTILPDSDLTVAVQAPYFFDPVNYKLGSNVIVVWPVAGPGTPTVKHKPYMTCVFFQLASGIENPQEEKFSVTPNPAGDYLEIKSVSKNSVKDVRIFDSAGKLVLDLTNIKEDRLSLKDVGKGFYLMQIHLKNDKPIYHRFIKN